MEWMKNISTLSTNTIQDTDNVSDIICRQCRHILSQQNVCGVCNLVGVKEVFF